MNENPYEAGSYRNEMPNFIMSASSIQNQGLQAMRMHDSNYNTLSVANDGASSHAQTSLKQENTLQSKVRYED